MEIAISTVEFWESVGFDTSGWRKSMDGSLAMAHIERAERFVPKIRESTEITIYLWPSPEFAALESSPKWAGEADGNV